MVASVSRVDDVAPVPQLPLHDDDSMDLSLRFKTPGSQGFELAQRSSLTFGGKAAIACTCYLLKVTGYRN